MPNRTSPKASPASKPGEPAEANMPKKALHESEVLKGAILQAALDCIIIIDGDSRILEWNPAAERTFGYTREVALGSDIAELIIPPEFRDRHHRGMAHYLATGEGPVLGKRVELESIRADGSRFPVELAISPIEIRGKPHFTAYVRDITERARAEQALRESEQRLRATYEHASVGISEVDVNGRFLRVNEQYSEMTGYSREELLERTFADITQPEDRERDLERFRRHIAGEIGAYALEKRYIHKDGHVVWIGLAASRVDDAQGRPLYSVRVVRDVTQRKLAEEALRESERRLRLAIEAGRMAAWEVDLATDTLRGSPELNRLLGFPEDARPTMAELRACYHPDDQARLRTMRENALARGERFLQSDFRYLCPDGSVRWLLLRAEIKLDADDKPASIVGVLLDITDRKRAEERKNLLINELNHRVRNTLATVQSIVSQALRTASSPQEARAAVESRLLALSRVHDVLTRESWEGAGLREIMVQAIAPFSATGERRIHIDGPDVWLQPRTALSLAMALQELLTNAIKYGALSNETGEVRITWTVSPTTSGRHLQLRWEEQGGPAVEAPSRRGLGSVLIERGLAQSLNGKVRVDFALGGVVCTLDAPLA
jgi:PAS domain S-box-containing protein